MSTICRLVARGSTASVAPAFAQLLAGRATAFERVDADWPLACDRGNFHPDEAFPTVFSVGDAGDGFVEIHFNGFAKLDAHASKLSWVTRAPVVVNIHQSAASASYWALHRDGARVRWIEAGDGLVGAHGGERLPFELAEPGRPLELEGDEGTLFGFDRDELEWYNRECGVTVELYRQPVNAWINYVAATALPVGPPARRRPWWRFW